MADRYCNYIDGKWVAAMSGATIVNRNPADTRDIIGEFAAGTREDARAAIAAAERAFPAWRSVPAPERGRIIGRAARIALERQEELARAMTREEGKILKEARGEVLKGVNLLEFYCGEGFRILGKTVPSEMRSTFTYTIRQPLGVVSLITPWNFPWAIPVWKSAPALCAGNTVVLKPASLTPHTALLLAEIYEAAGVPPGVFNVVAGSGGTVGDELVVNPAVRAVSFTGSNEVGMALNRSAASRGVKVTCEMGGKNAVVVLDDADLDLAVPGILQGAFGSTGQRCTATSRVVAHRKVLGELTERLVEETKKIVVGNGMDPGVTMGPAVDEAQLETDLRYIAIALEEGAKLLCGGRRLTEGAWAQGFFVEPTIFTDVRPEMRLAREEVFGPVLAILAVDSFDEAIRVANDVPFGLTASIYSRDANRILRAVDALEVGMVHVNSPTIGGEAQLPFGGIKATGIGNREMCEEGLNFFTELKTVFFDYTGSRRDTQIY
jgi:acyl-CoA reductase-like NAD-dependent aldehyde dehydrogenase